MHTFPKICLLLCFLFSSFLSNASTDIYLDSTDTSIDDIDSASINLLTDQIVLIGNKITKPRIILRELTFKKGDTITLGEIDQRIKRSEENLQNTSLFHSVKITWIQDNDRVNFYIVVTERWYIFPLPIFEVAERNFNVWWETKDFSRVELK